MNASINIITNLFVYLTMWLTSCSYTILHYLYLQEILTCKYSIAKILRFYEFKTYKVKYCNSLVNTHLKAIERSVITFKYMYFNHLWLKKKTFCNNLRPTYLFKYLFTYLYRSDLFKYPDYFLLSLWRYSDQCLNIAVLTSQCLGLVT